MLRHLLLALTLVPTFASAALPRPLSFDLAVGMPQTIALETQVQVAKHWQIGLGYGLLSAARLLDVKIDFSERSIRLADGNDYFYHPTAQTSFAMITPFVRFFPTERNMYFELTGGLFRFTSEFSSSLSNADQSVSLEGALNGQVTVTQIIPTLSMGHLFSGNFFFANLSLGVSFLSSVITSVSLKGAIPDALGGQAQNQAELDRLSGDISKAASDATRELKDRFLLIPSIRVAFGFLI